MDTNPLVKTEVGMKVVLNLFHTKFIQSLLSALIEYFQQKR